MNVDPVAALVSRLEGMQVRVANAGDRALTRQIIGADAAQMLTDVPASARSVLISAQVEGRTHAFRRNHPDAILLLLGEEVRTTGLLVLDWPPQGPVALLEFLFLPSLRGQGRGTRLLTALTQVADDRERMVRTRLFYDSRACRLLTRMGFVQARDEGTEIVMERPAHRMAMAV